jgi:hypothetical protein
MPRLVFPIIDPTAKVFSDLGNSMFGGNTLQSAIQNADLHERQAQGTEANNCAAYAASHGGVRAILSDPVAQAMLVRSRMDPKNINAIALMGGATQFGAKDPSTQNLQVGSGEPYPY